MLQHHIDAADDDTADANADDSHDNLHRSCEPRMKRSKVKPNSFAATTCATFKTTTDQNIVVIVM